MRYHLVTICHILDTIPWKYIPHNVFFDSDLSFHTPNLHEYKDAVGHHLGMGLDVYYHHQKFLYGDVLRKPAAT